MFTCERGFNCVTCSRFDPRKICEHWIEVAPVRRGHWIVKHFGDDAQCSVCGRSFSDAYDADTYDYYCRHCGAEMHGVSK